MEKLEISDVIEAFKESGQGHVFAFREELGEDELARLAEQAREIDLSEIARLVNTLVKADGGGHADLEGLEPAPYIAHPARGGAREVWEAARERGEQALRAGKVAAFTVAGGQGTRLGYDGPKGTYPVTPVTGKTLFQVFAEKILAATRRYGVEIPWFIMTSHANHEATEKAFREAGYFGLKPESVFLFRQGRMPAVDHDGRILLESKSSIAMSPDGHGGSLRALVRSGAVAEMRRRGIEVLSYFQVDNPLVQCIDPAFIGFHFEHGSEMSSKMIPKAYPLEKVGHFCVRNGRTVVIEYSDMPSAMQEERLENGKLRFIAGSIAIHLLGVDFVERTGGNDPAYTLPFHRADKKIPTIDAEGRPVIPSAPNGIKFEMFVFDALPFDRHPVIIETLREDEFSPVKNATGIDSPETCRNDQKRQWARWLAAAGTPIPTDETGLPEVNFEVSPLFADSQQAFVTKWQTLNPKPEIREGTILEG